MISTIGDAAGKIWEYLDINGESSLASIKKNLELKPEQVTMSLGWLAREGKVEMQKSGTSVKIQLIK
ncbi:MAG: winged helix-turn-helix domain-containing protein [Candidatus Gastranaerophilales bacterium]|nr:winged helix-turn-helix domain-containing protein [Candidatus Gastranaerophilales bacterium]